MTISSVNAGNTNVFTRMGQSIKDQAKDTYRYMQDVKGDTAEFVKRHPKGTAISIGVGAAAVIIGSAVKKAIENARQRHFQKEVIKTIIEAQNDARKMELENIVHRQASKIKTMKNVIKADKEMLAANHEAIEAARNQISKLKKADKA